MDTLVLFELTIIIPVKNNIDAALDSLAKIDDPRIEVLLVGTGITKRKMNSNVTHIRENVGIYQAMNVGLERSKGQYVYFMGATDTIYASNILACLDGSDVVIGRVKAGKRVLTYRRYAKNINYIHHQAFVSKKNNLKFNLKYHVFSDLDYMNNRLKDPLVSRKDVDLTFCDFTKGGTSNNRKQTLRKMSELASITKKHDSRYYLNIAFWLNMLRLIWYRLKC